MFATPINYPCAISAPTSEGEEAALRWVLERLDDDKHLTVWATQKGVLAANDFARALTSRPDVHIAVGRGSGYFVANGPVLALYADADDLGKITRARGITALCLVQWPDQCTTWAKEVEATVLDEPDWDRIGHDPFGTVEAIELRPEVVAALESMTQSINHNNTISAGHEKAMVVRTLLKLHDDGLRLPAQQMKEWAAAHGWSGDNPKRLAAYADRINEGPRPRAK